MPSVNTKPLASRVTKEEYYLLLKEAANKQMTLSQFLKDVVIDSYINTTHIGVLSASTGLKLESVSNTDTKLIDSLNAKIYRLQSTITDQGNIITKQLSEIESLKNLLRKKDYRIEKLEEDLELEKNLCQKYKEDSLSYWKDYTYLKEPIWKNGKPPGQWEARGVIGIDVEKEWREKREEARQKNIKNFLMFLSGRSGVMNDLTVSFDTLTGKCLTY
jgi:hypothetical protein